MSQFYTKAANATCLQLGKYQITFYRRDRAAFFRYERHKSQIPGANWISISVAHPRYHAWWALHVVICFNAPDWKIEP